MKKFRFSIDRGGTFTDIYAEVPNEQGYQIVKLLSEDPANYTDAPREAIRRILEDVTSRPFPKKSFSEDLVEWIRMGTTVATNALLERKGSRCALLTTKGFGDLLQIGYQNRPNIFDLVIEKPELLYEQVVEIEERVRPLQKQEIKEGKKIVPGTQEEPFVVLSTPSEPEVKKILRRLKKEGIESIAVVFLHSFLFPDHEKMVGKWAKEIEFKNVSLSFEVSARSKVVARGDTTLVDAYLSPIIRDYIEGFRSGFDNQLKDVPLWFMKSDGGLASADRFIGSKAILSGPAGGVVGYGKTSYHPETKRPVIGFDMGGTSTDVSRYAGQVELTDETETAGVRIQTPQIHISTVAAGGGSRLFFRNGMFEVGPESAGANPGPVCYRNRGPLAITDANLFLGRIQTDYFPSIFGESGNRPLDFEATGQAFAKLTQEINRHPNNKNSPKSPEEIALGFLDVANEVMARPIREIAASQGLDMKQHCLAVMGGAGGQHACAVANALGIREIFIHRFAGILSAYGMNLADMIIDKSEPVAQVNSEKVFLSLQNRFQSLEKQAVDELRQQGFESTGIHLERYLHLRYQGTETSYRVPVTKSFQGYLCSFEERYRREFGFSMPNREVLIDTLRVLGVGRSATVESGTIPFQGGNGEPETTRRVYFAGGWQSVPIFRWDHLRVARDIIGPVLIMNETSTILLEPGWKGRLTEYGNLEIHQIQAKKKSVLQTFDSVQLSIFSHRFMSIAEQMGRALQRTAISTNIKERLDFSCAVFDSRGNLVANAPHQPVHLGSMSEAVKFQREKYKGNWKPGEVIVSNHPSAGGSHLPDMTVMTPVFLENKIMFYLASRGHHADIGGITPGSMPPFSRELQEEGACILSFKLVRNGRFEEEGIRKLLADSRLLEDNIADLKAQIAANQKGVSLLNDLIKEYSLPTVRLSMESLQKNTEGAIREMLKNFALQQNISEKEILYSEDTLDDGTPMILRLNIHPTQGEAIFDFQGTGTQLWGNLNTPKAVTTSAILYSLRCLLDQSVPLNQGCLNPIRMIIPEGSILAPSEEAAVVGGNVLTSQRITDVILKAFKAAADSQGCMNNWTFGDDTFGYYETIGGGAGAGNGWHGQSGVHTHMTNTRITDPEILERRYPVLLREFSLREGSGGKGKYQGGDGLSRKVEFLAPLEVGILSERRVFAPCGIEGGESGKKGKNILIRKNGRRFNLGGKSQLSVRPGDQIHILTPGGGGYGKMTTRRRSGRS